MQAIDQFALMQAIRYLYPPLPQKGVSSRNRGENAIWEDREPSGRLPKIQAISCS